jgi:hypothetical protein
MWLLVLNALSDTGLFTSQMLEHIRHAAKLREPRVVDVKISREYDITNLMLPLLRTPDSEFSSFLRSARQLFPSQVSGCLSTFPAENYRRCCERFPTCLTLDDANSWDWPEPPPPATQSKCDRRLLPATAQMTVDVTQHQTKSLQEIPLSESSWDTEKIESSGTLGPGIAHPGRESAEVDAAGSGQVPKDCRAGADGVAPTPTGSDGAGAPASSGPDDPEYRAVVRLDPAT